MADCEVHCQRYWVAIRYLKVLNSRGLLKHSQEFFPTCSCNLVPRQVDACQCIIMLTNPIRNNLGARVRNIVFPQIEFRDHILILQEAAKFYYITIGQILVLNLDY